MTKFPELECFESGVRALIIPDVFEDENPLWNTIDPPVLSTEPPTTDTRPAALLVDPPL